MFRRFAEQAVRIDPTIIPAYLLIDEDLSRSDRITLLRKANKQITPEMLKPNFSNRLDCLLVKAELGDALYLDDPKAHYEESKTLLWEVARHNSSKFTSHISLFDNAWEQKDVQTMITLAQDYADSFGPEKLFEACESLIEIKIDVEGLLTLAINQNPIFADMLAYSVSGERDFQRMDDYDEEPDEMDVDGAARFSLRSSAFPEMIRRRIEGDAIENKP